MASESDDEDFVSYGTPLEPLDEGAVPAKRAITVEDQVAKDKHGRRRFHGAFTGGFSAGFFNSVGSLEGWKPSQFKSSRSSKFQAQVQRPEDFMDDEDMDEFGIAPKTLQPTSEYKQADQGNSRKRNLKNFSHGPIPGLPVLQTLEPVKETIGITLMMKMGWKPGQGVGPRLSKLEKTVAKKSQPNKVYGCALPNQGPSNESSKEDTSDEEPMDLDVTFAPDDFEPYRVKPKTDVFGLGYSGLDRRPVLSSHVDLFGPPSSSLVMQDKKKRVNIRGQAFGVGAFEREDEDIYAKEDMGQYDFALDTPQMLAEKRKQERNSRKALPASSSDVLEGFVMSSKPVVQKKYPPPPLPQGFTPVHREKESRFSASVAIAPDVNAGKPRLTVEERGVLVNETARGKPSVNEEKDPGPVTVERTSSGSFKPFLSDPEKQQRYEKYLTLVKLGQTDKLKILQPLNMTEWEQQREVSEFSQASRLYRPLSAAFSDRFVSASQPDDATDPLAPVARTPSAEDSYVNAAKHKMYGKLTRRVGEWSPHSTLCKRFNIPQPGSSSSASQSRPTRPKFSVFNFLDAAPFNARATVEENAAEVKVPCQDTDKVKPEGSAISESSASLMTLELAVDSAVEKKKEDTAKESVEIEKLVESTNKMDLFKAIFLSSSDESDNEEEIPGTSTTSAAPTEKKKPEEVNVLRNTSPPRGIFANLDLDKLRKPAAKQTEINKPKSPPRGIFANLDLEKLSQPKSSKSDVEPTNQNEEKVDEPDIEEDNMYGPPLPRNPPLQKRLEDVTVVKSDSSDSEDEWVEQEDSSDSNSKSRKHSKKKHSKKSHRKSKKHKEKKHKHKKKKK